MWRDAVLVASKDLRIEVRSRVALNQIAPFAGVVLLLFGFALDANPTVLSAVGGGLFWVAVLFSTVLAVQRSFGIESADSAGESLRLAGLDPAGIFLGKAAAIAVQLLALQGILVLAIAFLFHVHLTGIVILITSDLLATVGIAAVGTIYGAISASTRIRETLLPLLFLPIVAPVLLSASQAWQYATAGHSAQGAPWLRILVVFAAVYVVAGIFAFEPIMEQA